MSWVQLGLALQPPRKVQTKSAVTLSKSKPIRKVRPPKRAVLAPGELDDPIDDLFRK